MADVVELILAEHQQIRRSQRVLAAAASAGDPVPGGRLAGQWQRLAALIEMHADAAEEIFLLPAFGTGPLGLARIENEIAELADIREAIAETRLQPAGSEVWWQAVRAVLSACAAHIHRMESGPLPEFRDSTVRGLRERLGAQWSAFVSARSGSGA